jgi:hypothetical protein
MAREICCKHCGATVMAANDDALFDVAKGHFHHKHRFLPVTDDKIRAAIAEDAHDA